MAPVDPTFDLLLVAPPLAEAPIAGRPLVDPLLVDPLLVDPLLVDPLLVDPLLVDPLLVDPPPPLRVVGFVSPPVPVAHCVAPCLSQAAGIGASSASWLGLVVENVGLLQLWMLMSLRHGTGDLRDLGEAGLDQVVRHR